MPARQSRQSTLNWRKSRASSATTSCVEIARAGPLVLVRDSGQQSGTLLGFTPTQWTAFVARVQTGKFTGGAR
jgi:hypothetical protein